MTSRGVVKKDGFIKGTPDEFLSFINSRIVKKKKSKKRIAFICIAGIITLSVVVSYYVEFGRTIFESRAKPTEAELEKIHEILSYEQEKLSECMELLSPYNDRINELGIEIHPVLEQKRAVNNQGLVEKHDWVKDMWLLKYYSSDIDCFVYKDGKRLTNRTSTDSVSYFGHFYCLLSSGKYEDTAFIENPFKRFDTDFEDLLNRVEKYLLTAND